jgi:hypothetical protein
LLQKAAVIDSLPQAIQEEPVILLGKEYKLVINDPKDTIAANTAVNKIDLKIITCLLSEFAVQMKTLRTSSCNANDSEALFWRSSVQSRCHVNFREYAGIWGAFICHERPKRTESGQFVSLLPLYIFD